MMRRIRLLVREGIKERKVIFVLPALGSDGEFCGGGKPLADMRGNSNLLNVHFRIKEL